ncbi:hypothetical protein M8J75_005906 [Diaphorina citri]|nr:hypothetical protein M8J75_005906 [Diaphorina citri]
MHCSTESIRIRNEKNGGAWCPKAQISSEVREYLEIDLSRNHLITLTETQGRFGNGQGQEYAEGFLIEYWRDTLNQWVVYNENGTKGRVANGKEVVLRWRRKMRNESALRSRTAALCYWNGGVVHRPPK